MGSEAWVNPRYRILAGPFALPPEQVQVQHDPSADFPVSPQNRLDIDRVCQELREKGQRVEQNPLHRFLEHSRGPSGELLIKTGVVDYEGFLGSIQLRLPPAKALCVAAITDVEGTAVLEERSGQVAQGAGLFHVVPSGHVHPHQSPWTAVVEEAKEELGLAAEELLEPLCLGLVQSLTAPVVVLIYRYRTELTWADLGERRPVDAWEHLRLLPLALEAEAMESWLRASFGKFATNPGHAAVFLEGWRRFGETWARRVWSNFT